MRKIWLVRCEIAGHRRRVWPPGQHNAASTALWTALADAGLLWACAY